MARFKRTMKRKTAIAKPKRVDWSCAFRGAEVEKRTCHICGNRGKQIPVYECKQFGKCTIDPWKSGQAEKCCKRCDAIESS